ncbi:unnamed protein product [Alopecurus aequalis]
MKTRRCCPTAGTSNDATGKFSTLWTTSLPGDILLLVAWHVLAGDFLDYVRFRAVCPQWRGGTVCPHGRSVADPRFHPRRWIMFPEGHGLHPGHYKLHGHLRFLNLDTGTFVSVHLPHFNKHCVLDSLDGLLLLQRDNDTAVRLLHPFTGDIAELPPLSTLIPQVNRYRNDHEFLASGGSLVVRIDPPPQAGSAPPLPTTIAMCSPDKIYCGYKLVECDSEILLVGHTDSSRTDILMYKLEDMILGRFIPVTSIGDRALFLLILKSLSVSTKAMPTVMPETVVCLDPRTHEYSQYHLDTGTWSTPVDECGIRGYEPMTWVLIASSNISLPLAVGGHGM